MSKLGPKAIEDAIDKIYARSIKKFQGKPVNTAGFIETIDLQIALKNYDPQKDKRIYGTIRLPFTPRPKFKVCIFGDAAHISEAEAAGIPTRSVEQLTLLKKDKKKVKKLAKQYGAFLASSTLIRKIPRLLGPGLNKAGKFPTAMAAGEDVADRVEGCRASVKFQLKSKKSLCMGVAVGNIGLKKDELLQNVNLAINFLVSLLPKNWQQIKRIFIKSSQGPPQRVYGF